MDYAGLRCKGIYAKPASTLFYILAMATKNGKMEFISFDSNLKKFVLF
jgi:hypothetical protein